MPWRLDRWSGGSSSGTGILVVDMRAAGDIDATGVHTVAALDRALAAAGIQLRLVTVRGPVHDALQRAGVAAMLAGKIDADVPVALRALDLSGPLADRAPDEPTSARPLR